MTPARQTDGDWVAIFSEELPLEAVARSVADPTAGGIAVFIGTTRENHSAGRELLALDYEAYEEMALQQLHDLARRAQERWPIVRLTMLHRVGRVKLAEASVAIAVSTPHRAEAFEACRWLIDTLKAEVAIWKKEIWSDGSGTWSGGQQAHEKHS